MVVDGETKRRVVPEAGTIERVVGEELEGKYEVLPAYWTERVCEPRVKLERVILAVPVESSDLEPREVAPSKKVTLPFGVPVEEVTEAKIVTGCPRGSMLLTRLRVVVESEIGTLTSTLADWLEANVESPE